MKSKLKQQGFSDKDIYTFRLFLLYVFAMSVTWWISTSIAHYQTSQVKVSDSK
jgi:hypothetical protein